MGAGHCLRETGAGGPNSFAQANIATSMADAPSEPESSVSPLSTRSRRLAASVLLTFHSSFVFLKQLLSFVGEFLGLLDALPQRLLRLLDLFDLLVWCFAHCAPSGPFNVHVIPDVPRFVGHATRNRGLSARTNVVRA